MLLEHSIENYDYLAVLAPTFFSKAFQEHLWSKKQAPFTRRQLTPDRTLATGAVGFELRAVCDDPAANGKMIDTKLAFEHHFFEVLGAHKDTLCTRAHRSGSLLWENGRLLELMAMVSPS
jgi:hypothetical protein